ncbi:MAG TPA: dihydrodipicolinate synthase family protein [Ktedonobacteraceae bacterium]|nr:dihydrodipicolinate synthase family protein [Ktedonobacteraceae bacterium]
MTRQIHLPRADGACVPYVPGQPGPFPESAAPPRSRVAYAAAHVVCDPLIASAASPAHLDWEATLAYRRHLWKLGLAVAEAMDTAQRGMGLDWTVSRELIRRSVAEARACGGSIACGAGTDQLVPTPHLTLADVQAAYEEQCEFIEGQGGRIILMASRALAACAQSPDDYLRVYERILSQVAQPVILHWLGDMFDPALAGYWGERDLDAAMEVCLDLIRRNAAKIDGIKLSLLDARREVALRRRLPEGVRLYSGDDFNYPELIRGDEQGYSHALLGIFDAIAPAAAAALQALDAGDMGRYEALLAPTVTLSRHIFQAPTYYYKTGVVFLAYLNGHQSHFRMVAGMESARSIVHLAELFVLADKAGLLRDPELAIERMRRVLAVAGIIEGGEHGGVYR